jgi:y4mF family transcriptional regulator
MTRRFVSTPADLGRVVRERRRALDLSQEQLADRAGVSRQWVVALEAGKERAELGLTLRLLRSLDLNVFVEEAGDDDLLAAMRGIGVG